MKYDEEYIQGNHSKGKTIIPIGLVMHHISLSRNDIINMFTHKKGYLEDGREFTGVSAHCVIWKNGNRTIFGFDTQRMWGAGESLFMGRLSCNDFMLQLEFHGDTNVEPLTNEQIESFIEWFIPKKEMWFIPKEYVTDHRTIRDNFIEKYCEIKDGKAYYNNKRIAKKVDLNPVELEKVLMAIDKLWL